jgi:hypothetical protein
MGSKKKYRPRKSKIKSMEELTAGHERLVEKLKLKGVKIDEDEEEFDKLLQQAMKPSSD